MDVRLATKRAQETSAGARLLDVLARFTFNEAPTVCLREGDLDYFVNEFWTAGQRQAHSLHEVSYRACFKPQLPEFFISRLTGPGASVYDPFSGRGTTGLQAALMGRRPLANDVNPLSGLLLRPRLAPPEVESVRERLQAIALDDPEIEAEHEPLLAFYHRETLRHILALRSYFLGQEARRATDRIDEWIRMVAINRLTGHSSGFLSVYTLPPNQAVSPDAQRRINAARCQTPPFRDLRAIILKKTRALLANGRPPVHPEPLVMTGPAHRTPAIPDGAVDLLVTSPPFLDIVDYAADNWLRCWFAGIDASSVRIDRHREIRAWEGFVRLSFLEFARVMRPGGIVAFEVGEVRGGRVLLERHVASAIEGLPFRILGVMLNRQEFTKTANCWGVSNNRGGTNSNRIVIAERSPCA
jgi:hypothetical protein